MKVTVGNIEFGGNHLPVIAGPCVIESEDHSVKMADALKSICEELDIPFVFKSSFDKANRTSVGSFRGPGLDKGLEILQKVKEKAGVAILTDIHGPEQAGPVGEVVDIIQIPAFLCRQTDLLLAAGETGKCVNVKKGQFLAPWDMTNVVKKIESTGNTDILLTERGVSFGYNNLVSDMRALPFLKEMGYPVVFDATHSAQRPGGLGDRSGGDRDTIPSLARAAVAAGFDAIFVEVHDSVDEAKSDAVTQWPLERTKNLLSTLKKIRELVMDGEVA
ncbi:MAG: 3-deoxy-8-phosphooctulonate synthase [Candidatus Neomarinimicrobiota bacterium]